MKEWIYRIGKGATTVLGALVASGTLPPLWAGVAAGLGALASLFKSADKPVAK